MSLTSILISAFLSLPITSKEEVKIVDKAHVILLGDSLAQGMAHEFSKTAKAKGYKPIVLAKGGTWSNYWSGSIGRIVDKYHPQFVIVSLGTNDSTSSKPEPQRLHIKKIREKVTSSGARLLWLTPPQLPKRFKSRDEIRKILADEIPQTETFNSDDLPLEKEKDKVHMTPKGYRDWILAAWTRVTTN